MKRYIRGGSNRRSHYRVDPNEVKSAIQKYCIDKMNDILEEKGYGPVKLLRNSVRFNPEMRDDSDDMIYYLYDFKDKDGVVTTGYYSFIKDRFGDWVPISETGEDENGVWPDLEDYAANTGIDLYN